jgi:hypothetical protein
LLAIAFTDTSRTASSSFQFAARSSVRHFSALKEVTVRDALNAAIDEEMARDPTVFLMGTLLAF